MSPGTRTDVQFEVRRRSRSQAGVLRTRIGVHAVPGAETRVRDVRELPASGFTVEDVKSFVRFLDAELPEVFACSPACADAYGLGARRVAELEEGIASLTRLRDILVRRMPWLWASGDTAGQDAA